MSGRYSRPLYQLNYRQQRGRSRSLGGASARPLSNPAWNVRACDVCLRGKLVLVRARS